MQPCHHHNFSQSHLWGTSHLPNCKMVNLHFWSTMIQMFHPLDGRQLMTVIFESRETYKNEATSLLVLLFEDSLWTAAHVSRTQAEQWPCVAEKAKFRSWSYLGSQGRNLREARCSEKSVAELWMASLMSLVSYSAGLGRVKLHEMQ